MSALEGETDILSQSALDKEIQHLTLVVDRPAMGGWPVVSVRSLAATSGPYLQRWLLLCCSARSMR